MRIRIEVDDRIKENEVLIRCGQLTDEVYELQKSLTGMMSKKKEMVFYKGETEFYIPLEEILFFETDPTGICAHTINQMYQVKYKLYELEELLPRNFMRVSKSTILNVNHIYSITRNLTASSVVEFQNTHKQVYISRYYYKAVKEKIKEKRS
ncbi:MAG: LytTR family DNA-binding domain-containing protein [bacterium]|nr:LytTR family DNA-binding domain-containing protein [bacterium]